MVAEHDQCWLSIQVLPLDDRGTNQPCHELAPCLPDHAVVLSAQQYDPGHQLLTRELGRQHDFESTCFGQNNIHLFSSKTQDHRPSPQVVEPSSLSPHSDWYHLRLLVPFHG